MCIEVDLRSDLSSLQLSGRISYSNTSAPDFQTNFDSTAKDKEASCEREEEETGEGWGEREVCVGAHSCGWLRRNSEGEEGTDIWSLQRSEHNADTFTFVALSVQSVSHSPHLHNGSRLKTLS